MNDEALREQIDLYVAGVLDDAERAVVEQAVEDNPRAASWLAESRRTWSALDECTAAAAPDGIARAAWRQAHRPVRRRRRLAGRLAVAAALVLAFAGYWRFGRAQPVDALSPQDREVVQDLDFLLEMELLENIDLVRQADVARDLEGSGLSEPLEALPS